MTEGLQSKSAILVVDDDPRIGTMLKRYLDDEGYVVTVTADGEAMKR